MLGGILISSGGVDVSRPTAGSPHRKASPRARLAQVSQFLTKNEKVKDFWL
jgi:hypothetical protein